MRISLLLLALSLLPLAAQARPMTFVKPDGSIANDAEISRYMVQLSIKEAASPCACPYQVADEKFCGKESLWSKQSGNVPLCFVEEVDSGMLDLFKNGKLLSLLFRPL